MGGTIATWLAVEHPDAAALIAVNPMIEPLAPEVIDALRSMLDAQTEVMPGVGSDIAKPGVVECAYEGTPIAPLISFVQDGVRPLSQRLADVRCPVLLFTSPEDHVVSPSSSDLLAAEAAGPVERVSTDRSYHVSTMDYDAAEIERRSVEFLSKVLPA
jgi:carboxylesterase